MNYLVEQLGSRKQAREHQRRQDRGGLFVCPYPHWEILSDGTISNTREAPDCMLGKGVWCSKCSQYTRHQAQKRLSKKMYEAQKKRNMELMRKTGKVAWKRDKVNLDSILNPIKL